jgi:hypothetical protein
MHGADSGVLSKERHEGPPYAMFSCKWLAVSLSYSAALQVSSLHTACHMVGSCTFLLSESKNNRMIKKVNCS